MEFARWLAVSPLLVAVTVGGLGAGRLTSPLVAEPPWEPPPCPAEAGVPPGLTTWYRLEPLLDRTGTLAGRTLTIGTGGEVGRSLDLAPESFASGPVNGMVLTGEDDGAASHLRLLDVARGCTTALADEAAVIRSAVLAPDGQSLYEHRVDRTTRTDLGVWRRRLDGATGRVLAGLAPDPWLGPTFVTTMALDLDGWLTVSSCTPAGCRVRVLDPASGAVTLVRDIGAGLGTVAGSLIARAACAGLPCPIVSVDLASGRRTTLAAEAFAAAIGGLAGDRLVVEATGDGVTVVELTGAGVTTTTGPGVPLARGSTATAGVEGRPGTVALVPRDWPGGRGIRLLDLDRSPSRPQPGASR
jgi:hypothetical protein